MTTGRVFAAKPRSASHTSPGRGFIEQIQYFLFHSSCPHYVQSVLISQINDFHYPLPDLISGIRLPLLQFRIQPFHQGVHWYLHLLPPNIKAEQSLYSPHKREKAH
jgi:hypothetical protein